MRPVYIKTHQSGLLKEKIKTATAILKSCILCPRRCKVDRLAEETGICKTGSNALISSYNAHFGEETPLVGQNGSGTIFFTHCNLLCVFCQNYDISHEGDGEPISSEQLARVMLALQHTGCHNINFVTPSHVVPQILSALEIAVEEGLNIPLVYNTSGYDEVETIKLLEGVIDIYMPDFKFWDSNVSEMTCDASDYPQKAKQAIKEMHRQVGDLKMDENGIAYRGLLIRHLVMPEGLAGTQPIMAFIANHISTNTYVNIMPQYRPCGKAFSIAELSRKVTATEFENALELAKKEGINRLDPPRRIFAVW